MKPTKQQLSRERNWRIFRLRGLYANLHVLSETRRKQAQQLVDEELLQLKAESETQRHERLINQYLHP